MSDEIDVEECVPTLEKFAYLITGDDDVSSEATSLTLQIAKDRLCTRRRFPNRLSWLLHILWSDVLCDSLVSASEGYGGSLISLLQIPLPERAILVLVDGYHFDLTTTACIVDEPLGTVSDRLEAARTAFMKLARIGDTG